MQGNIMITYFYKENCPHCDSVKIPGFLEVNMVNVEENDLLQMTVPQVPLININGLNFQGAQAINLILDFARNIKQQ